MAGFVDFTLIADAITGGDSTAAQQIKSLMVSNADMEEQLSALATEPCKSEIRQLAASMPMMVTGNRRFEVTEDRVAIDAHFAMLLENEEVRNTLKLLRGVVPESQSGSSAMLSFGMGFDVDSLPQLASKLTELVSSLNYTCEPLSFVNKVAGEDMSAVGMGAMMFSGMARGVKGISLNLYDVNVNPESDL